MSWRQMMALCACRVYDPMIGDRLLNKLQRRPKASFDFVQEGRFQKQAELQRLRVRAPDSTFQHRHTCRPSCSIKYLEGMRDVCAVAHSRD